MNQGAKRAGFAVRGDDLYETPRCAVDTLLRHASLPAAIWEPACGPGAIVEPLRAAGRTVVATDLVDYGNRRCPDSEAGRDFLFERERLADTIVTNPPFKLANEFIRHGLSLGCQVIVLLRLMALEGVGRADIMDGHCMQVLMGRERLPMMHRDGWAGSKIGNSGAPFAWFFFHPIRKIDSAITVRRVSWRGAEAIGTQFSPADV